MNQYGVFAPYYDLLSAEFPVYRAGRVLGIEALDLKTGDQVLDLGCGTGLNFPLLRERIGTAGSLSESTRAPQCLSRRAAGRNSTAGRTFCSLRPTQPCSRPPILAYASRPAEAGGGRRHADAAIATYSLSIMHPWNRAWENLWLLCRHGARLSVVDMQDPTGAAALLTPLARLAARLGGADLNAHPWQLLERDCHEVVSASVRGGHIQTRAGQKA